MRPGSLTPPDTGRKAYREPGEPKDERPAIRVDRFWDSEEQRAAYMGAVVAHPRRAEEGLGSYIRRIAGIVARGPLGEAGKHIPSRWAGPARPIQGPPEPPYELRGDEYYGKREPGQEG